MDSAAAPAPPPTITFSARLGEGHHQQAFDIAVAQRRVPHVRKRHLAMRPVTSELLEQVGMTIEGSADVQGGRLWYGNAGVGELVEVLAGHRAGTVRAAASTIEEAEALLDEVATALAEEQRPADTRVPVWFWTMSQHGPNPIRRKLRAPEWATIAGNYAPGVRDALDQIMTGSSDRAQGVALWRGAPGTGKTTALRALAREWREEAELHVVVDPEVFLGDKASYLVEVLFGDMGGDWDDDEEEDGYPGSVNVTFASQYVGDADAAHIEAMHAVHMADAQARRRARPRAKIVVLEDAGELIAADARVASGQALSRLLNLTDGMLGQGANVSVLVTTNEPIDRLHPAVARPGRGWAHVEFRSLTADDANSWLEQHGSDERVDGAATIAELYALLEGGRVVALDDLSSEGVAEA